MDCRTNYIKYSIFGKFDFLEANPTNISKMYGIFGKYNFLPNMIQMIQIQHPQNTITTISRPQFINNDMKCNITFLSERIDIEFKEVENFSIAMDYYNEILDTFPLEVNRIALNTGLFINSTTSEERESIRTAFINNNSYPFEEEVFEWNTRNVARKKCDEINEFVNVCQNVTCDGMANPIQVDIDINTLGELTENRFKFEDFSAFFSKADMWAEEIIENIKGLCK